MHLIPMRLQRIAPSRAASGLGARICNFGMYTAGFLAVVNISIMYLVLRQVETHLHARVADQQWILSIYPLMEGGFTLALGVLGDSYGCKRVLGAATWLFIIATLACAVAPTAGMLIVGRGVQGIAGAALLSLPLAILIDLQPDPSNNLRIVQLFATVAAIAAGLAPLIGGALVTWFGWPSVFYFSAVLALVVLAALWFAPDTSSHRVTRFDVRGQVTAILACLAISYALIEGNARGYGSPQIVAAFCLAAAAAALFLLVERRTQYPMVNLRYFRVAAFDASLLVAAIVNFGWYGLMLLTTFYLQHASHLREIAVGAYLMPCNVAYFIANLYSARLARRSGMPVLLIAGFAVSVLGMAWMLLLAQQSPPWHIAAALGISGFGWGVISTPATSLGMSAVRSSDEGFASGTLALSRSLSGVFGIAVLGALSLHLAAAVCILLTFVFATAGAGMLRASGRLIYCTHEDDR
ncbi:MAG TPA: MFS transporter [Candidatus Baltobacteraceae bacterium]